VFRKCAHEWLRLGKQVEARAAYEKGLRGRGLESKYCANPVPGASVSGRIDAQARPAGLGGILLRRGADK
jgi:hypothetical protein